MSHGMPLPGGKPKKAPNHERWVISYADLLTLLLAFFVVLYASSTRSKAKEAAAAGGFIRAFHGTPAAVTSPPAGSRGVMAHQPSAVPKPVEAPAIPATPTAPVSKIPKETMHKLEAEVLALQKVREKLETLLQPLSSAHQVTMVSLPLTLTIQLDASVLFASGQADLKPAAVTLLRQVAGSLQQLPPPFTTIVQGYTDDQPIATARFPSNWALSVSRAVTVVQLFNDSGLNGGQLAAEGFGQFAPVASNATDEGRAQNRRVVLVIHAPEPDAPGP